MPNEKDGDGWLVILFVLVILVVSVAVGWTVSNATLGNFQREAVEMGHARWIGEGTGSMKFEWLPPCRSRE